MTPDAEFERELEMFRKDAEAGTQFFYADITINAVARDNKEVHALLQRQAPLFWMTCLGALQVSTFMALGRIFDQGSAHNVDALLRIAQRNRVAIFSKEALGRRKQGNNAETPAWLSEYLRTAYEPTPVDFRRLRIHVQKRRSIYDRSYRKLRNKWFAHKNYQRRS
jgi:AbiU2